MGKFKVGDKVRIKNREGKSSDYPLSFTDLMSLLAGAICRIVTISTTAYDDNDRLCRYFNGDYSTYYLKPVDRSDNRNFNWYWHSSMFEPVEEEIPETESDNKVLTTQKIQNNEIRFQKPQASSKRGVVPAGRTISGRKDKIAISIGHLSYQVCNC